MMSIRLPFFNNKQEQLKETVTDEIVIDKKPEHVAIIMDGNGRWANRRGLPRIAGHKEGMNVVQRIVRAAVKHNVKILTMYAFSTENWKRPKPEVDFLLKLPMEFSHVYLPEMIENNVRIDTIGEFSTLPQHTKKAIIHAKKQTEQNNGLLLNIALNYGGRYEIMRAIKAIVNDIECGDVTSERVDEQLFSEYLYTKQLPDPDLLIR